MYQAQLNASQNIDYSTENGLKVYQRAIYPLTNPLYDVNLNIANLFYHTLEDRSEYQGRNFGNGDIVKIPRSTNANITKDMIFNNLQIERE